MRSPTLIFLPSMPMSAIQCWPQLFGQPVTCSFRCCSKPGRRSSSSSTSQREKALVSVMASLQNSVPVQATAPRQKGEPRPGGRRSQLARKRIRVSGGHVHDQQILHVGGANLPARKRSARSAAVRICRA